MVRFENSCDYAAIRAAYPWILERRSRFIISADLDGLMSATLLSHVLDWELAGVYTLDDLYIVSEDVENWDVDRSSPEDVLRAGQFCFVDHDIYRNYAKSIGHHFLQWSSETSIPLHETGNGSLNPNLLRGVTKRQAFNRKYPFGTFHFLLACFSVWDLLDGFQPDDELTTLLLHIDSSFKNAINYQDNALSWLDWLGGSDEGSPLYPICRRMLRFNPRTIIEQFKALAERFKNWGLKPRRQAAFTDPMDHEKWESQQRMLGWVTEKTGWRLKSLCTPDKNYLHFSMRRESDKPTKRNFLSVIEKEPFSYAIISSGEKGLNYNWFR